MFVEVVLSFRMVDPTSITRTWMLGMYSNSHLMFFLMSLYNGVGSYKVVSERGCSTEPWGKRTFPCRFLYFSYMHDG